MTSQTGRPQFDGLTKRSAEILCLLAEGLSDREIAERLVVTVGTVKWYNRQIYRILGVSGRLHAAARARELQLLGEGDGAGRYSDGAYPVPVQRLPAETTPFIGRAHDLATLQRLLGATRLLTLVGPPGTGKTRLALQLARVVMDTFEGAYFVSLAPLSDPALVPHAIASELGVHQAPTQPVSATLQQALRHSQLVLLLDNCEHLLPEGAPYIADLLAAAPQVKVIATSREPLHLYGEQEYAVPPLTLPDLNAPEQIEPQALAAFESVALFLQRAQAVRPAFALTADNAADVAQICVRLDGLPLAIELAAARVKLLAPRALLARISNRLDALTAGAHDMPARQRTLRNTIDWSYHLLSPGEQTLFARLAVFRGGCSLEAIEAVCRDGLAIDVLDGLDSLVNKSLVQCRELPGGESRFVMLETLHEYAWERLRASGQAPARRQRHAAYFVDLAERAEPQLRRARQGEWFLRLETDHDNLRAALEWSLDEGEQTLGARLVGALGLYWYGHGYHSEARQWTQIFLERLDTVPTHYHAKVLVTAGMGAWLSDLDAAQRYFDQALRIARALDDPLTTAWALTFKGYTMMRQPDAALATAEEGLSLFQELNHQPGVAQALNVLGELARFHGDDARAQQAYEACLAVAQEAGETRRVRMILSNLACLILHAGEYERARELAEQGLRLALEMTSKLDIIESLAVLAGALGGLGQPERAARLLGAIQAALERMGATPHPTDQPEHERNIAAVRAQLDAQTFAAAWAAGRALSLEQAVAAALESDEA